MASGVTQKLKEELANGNLDLVNEAALKLLLVDDAYAFDPTVDFIDAGGAGDVIDHELSTTNYTGGFGGGGRHVPANRVVRRDDAGGEVEFDFDDELWSALGPSSGGPTIGGVVAVVEKTSDTDSWVLAFDDLDQNYQVNSGDFTYSPNAEGMFKF